MAKGASDWANAIGHSISATASVVTITAIREFMNKASVRIRRVSDMLSTT